MSLSKDRVLTGAVALADKTGIESFTMRKLAAALDVKPMTIYHHVPSKDEIFDGMVDLVFAEIALPPTDTDWRTTPRTPEPVEPPPDWRVLRLEDRTWRALNPVVETLETLSAIAATREPVRLSRDRAVAMATERLMVLVLRR